MQTQLPLPLSMTRAASLDLGTNTFRLLIADITHHHTLAPVLTKRAITRLGEGLLCEGIIQPQAFERGMEVIEHFARIIKRYRVEKVFAVATSFARAAKNRGKFIDYVMKRTGISVRILSGFEEALLTLRGIFSVVESTTQKCVVFDIGGGSTECIITEDALPLKIASINLGVVYLAETFITSDPPHQDELTILRKTIKDTLQKNFLTDKRAQVLSTSHTLIGTAGTVTTLAAIDLKMKRYDPLKVNNHRLTYRTIENIYHRLICLPREARRRIPGLEKGREIVIIPGAALVLEIMEYLGFYQLIVSDAGLLEGVLLDALSPDEK